MPETQETIQQEQPQLNITEESMSTLSALSAFTGSDRATEVAKEIHNKNTELGINGANPADAVIKEEPEPEEKPAEEKAPEGNKGDQGPVGDKGIQTAAPEKTPKERQQEVGENVQQEIKEPSKIVNPAYEPQVINHELVGEMKIGGAQNLEIDMNDPKAVSDYVTQTLGIESLDKLASVTGSWRKDAESFANAERSRQVAEGVVTNLPPQLQNAIMDFNSGRDWTEGITKYPGADYTKNVNDFSSKEIVNIMSSNKFTSEEWDMYQSGKDSEGEPIDQHLKGRINDTIETSKQKFSTNKSTIDGLRAQYLDHAQKSQDAYNNSVPSSVKQFNQAFPDSKSSVLEGIQKEFSDGGVNQLFFNQDGSLTPDAYSNYAMAKMGFGLYKQAIQAAEKNAVNTHVEQELLDGKQPIRKSGGPGTSGTVNPENTQQKVTKELDNIFGGTNKPGFKY